MPRIEGKTGERLTQVWAYLSQEEAHALLASLQSWAQEIEAGSPDPEWHTHVCQAPDPELTIANEL